jgi:hypothetical protein
MLTDMSHMNQWSHFGAEVGSSGETPLDLSSKALFAQIRSVAGFALKPADRPARRS